MPKLLEKRKIEGLKGSVVTYADKNVGQFFYVEKVKGANRYRTKLVKGAASMNQAVTMAIEVALEMRGEEPHHLSSLAPQNSSKSNHQATDKLSILEREEKLQKSKERFEKIKENKLNSSFIEVDKAIDNWISVQRTRVRAKSLEENSFTHKDIILRIHLKGYLGFKHINRTSQINKKTFEDYLLYRKDTTRINQARELAVISEWIKYGLMKNGLIADTSWDKKLWMPKVEIRMVDRMANPAINDKDWHTILKYIRGPYLKDSENVALPKQRSQRYYFRYLFWHWVLVAKNSGMSPEEICKLKWKQIEVRDVGRISQSKAQEEIEELQAEGVDVLGPEPDYDPTEWAENPNTFGREERLVAYITTIRSKTKEAREIPCNLGRELRRLKRWQRTFLDENGYSSEIRDDDYVFFNPFNDHKHIHQARIGYNWRCVRTKLYAEGKLKGHKFSDKPYTLYSMRATFIEDHLIKGTDIFLLARIAGHDVKTLMQSYERMDIRKRAKEITDIEFGKKKDEASIVEF